MGTCLSSLHWPAVRQKASPDQSSFLGRSIKHAAACRMSFSAYRLAGPSFSRDTCKTCKGTFSDRQLVVLILPNPLLGHLYSPTLACQLANLHDRHCACPKHINPFEPKTGR
ncbi:hypothetical protein HER10_EVM0011446 [Colletotrichum scovillei]|uniref:uncharacterized protein n=1 Tax=Colletotrichum scovillei TaxID=1209932 RepID=UPI0015C36CE0|nr:uncharacterized protein HER10_EVM0011446 [Colletotrichum scovillei]KAF4774309.1 hypothetical protein HER10_EVM0011446 [Colletotrichum scovillei]